MGIFDKFKRKPAAPMLYQGKLMEVRLYPLEGKYGNRDHILGMNSRRNFWCELRTAVHKSGKYAGSSYPEVWVDGLLMGDIPARHLLTQPELISALNSGINGGTIFLERCESSEIAATLRLGNHMYMPRPYWQ